MFNLNPKTMKSVNRVTFLGHVVADPELKQTKNGKSVTSFAVATNNEWFDSEGTLQKSVDFHRVVAWDGLAKLCSQYLGKGSPIYIEGRLSNRAYEGKDKIKRFVTEVILSNLHILKWQEEKKTVQAKELAAA